MSDQIKTRLDAILKGFEEWVHAVGPISVSYAAPTRTAAGPHVNLFLLDVLNAPNPGPRLGDRNPPFQVLLRYLASVVTDDPIESQRLLCDLLYRATEHSEFEVDLSPLPFDLWSAFDVPPRPAFLIRVPLRLFREAASAPRVLRPPELRHRSIRTLRGMVMGPADQPIADARVEIPAARLATQTDSRGRFFFGGVPSGLGATAFRVQARSRDSVTSLELPEREEDALIIPFNPLEV